MILVQMGSNLVLKRQGNVAMKRALNCTQEIGVWGSYTNIDMGV